MNQSLLHELAIAYAEARLSRKQYESGKPHSKEELYNFAHDYQFAMDHLEEQLKQCPRI